LYGGVLGALTSFLIWVRLHRRSPLPLLDALVFPSAAAFAIARAGCFLNGCCGGKATHSFWGVVFPLRDSEKKFTGILALLGKTSVAVYPTQLFEMSLALIGLVPVMWLYLRKKPRAGTVFLLYGIWFTAMRWAILPLRNLPYPEFVTAIWLPVLYGGLIAAGLLLLGYLSGNRIRSIIKKKADA
jgi:phosphatidylglycerol:prolipoprotein diacylglycerol transferase